MKFIKALSVTDFVNDQNEVISFRKEEKKKTFSCLDKKEICSGIQINGRVVIHPVYRKIHSINDRVRNQSYYKEVGMAPIFDLRIKDYTTTERITYLYDHLSKFSEWLSLHLDKDILLYDLYSGNFRDRRELRLYDARFMVPITGKLNQLFTDHRKARGELPLGCALHSRGHSILSQCCDGKGKIKAKRFSISRYGSQVAITIAHFHYLEMKKKQIEEVIQEYDCDNACVSELVRRSLWHRIDFIDFCISHGCEAISIQRMIFRWDGVECEWWQQ